MGDFYLVVNFVDMFLCFLELRNEPKWIASQSCR